MSGRVLFVDDDPEILASYRRVFFGRFDTDCAAGGGPALDLMAERLAAGDAVDVVVADYLMPVMNGLEFLDRVREAHPGTPRILLTGVSDIEAAEQAARQGKVDLVLTKPCLPHHLARAIETTLAGRGGEGE